MMADFETGQFVFSIEVDSGQDADSAQRYIILRIVVPEGEGNETERLEQRKYLLTPDQAQYLYEGLLLSPLYNPDKE